MPAFPDLQVGSCRLKTKGRIQHCPHTVIERRSANLRPGDSGAGSGGSAVPEASAPVAVSKSAQNQTKPAENNTDRKSTRLNSSHTVISYAVFCLKKKKKTTY